MYKKAGGIMNFKIVHEKYCPGVYGAGKVVRNQKEWVAFVSELEGTGVIDLVDPDTFETVCASTAPGGGMNIVPLKENGEFLCIQKFFPGFKSEGADVVWGYEDENGYHTKEVLQLPFLHRIEVVQIRNEDYLMCATLCKTKEYIDDWSYPGSVYVGKINYEERSIGELQVVYADIFQNHGLTKLENQGGILIAGKNGVHRLVPPAVENDEWEIIEEITDPTSDCVAVDIDGDGELEYGTITPFHGKDFNIYKKTDGKFKKIYTLPGTHKFGHAIWAGAFNGKPAFIVGFRDAGKELILVEQNGEKIEEHLIDANLGPANVTVIPHKQGDLICAANRQTDRYTVYCAE